MVSKAAGDALDAEARILDAWRAGDRDGATTGTLRAYGAEIYSYLAAIHASEDDAGDAYSIFCEGLWATFDRFEGRCSIRTWAYALARRSSLRVRRDNRRRAARQIALPASSSALALAEQVRTATASYLATRSRTRIAELRASLPEEDQTLLLLRVDRGLPWADLARVLAEEETSDEAGLRRVSARLRKRFQLVREKLVEMGRREGLVP